jgi:hypothetical protein
MQISLHEIISWIVAVVSLTLFISEKLRKPRMQYYMALQGILMACYRKAVFYYSKSQLAASKTTPDTNFLYQDLCDHVSNDFNVLMQHVMGTMKSIEYKKDIPFDVVKFINAATGQPQQPNSTQV